MLYDEAIDADHPASAAFEAFLRMHAPPTTPAEACGFAPALAPLVERMGPIMAVQVLAGMMTEPRYQAHTVRLDYAIRLALGLSKGDKCPSRDDLSRLLNKQLVSARVDRLEDPIEDFFVEPLATVQGDRLLFSGYWEKASAHTEGMLDAFALLPDWEGKDRIVQAALALMTLSDALVRRAGLERRHIGAGVPKKPVSVPPDAVLRRLGLRVCFTFDEIADLGIDLDLLKPFCISIEAARTVLGAEPGDSAVEFQPLICTPEFIVVAAPANLALAARAWLIDNAVRIGLSDALRYALMNAQAALVSESGFYHLERAIRLPTKWPWLREFIVEHSAGRWMHVLQTVDGFDEWPQKAYAGAAEPDAEFMEALLGSIKGARKFIQEQASYRQGITLWLMGGWGAGRRIEFEDESIADWLILAIEPADAAVLGACEDAKPSDLWRLYRQLAMVRADGFRFVGINGFLNLFHWWRTTEYALLPPKTIALKPPAQVHFDTNLVLEARREGLEAIDRRMLPAPGGELVRCQRLDRMTITGELDPIYAALEPLRNRRVVGAAVDEEEVWWLELVTPGRTCSYREYEIWRATLKWIGLVLPSFWRRYGSGPALKVLLELDEREMREDEEVAPNPEAIELFIEDGETARLRVSEAWFEALEIPENVAESILARRILESVVRLQGLTAGLPELTKLVADAAGSSDMRFQHARRPTTGFETLLATGLGAPFRVIPQSAGALVKHGTGWMGRPRDLDPEIRGKDACVEYLADHGEMLLRSLITGVRRFDRRQLVIASLEALHGALAEQAQWRTSARALRAIHGAAADFEASLEQTSKINAVIRASSILVELANVEAPISRGGELGRMDLEELQAHALLYFQSQDTLAGLRGDRIKPVLQISPAGDVLSDHTFEDRTLKAVAAKRHERDRQQAVSDYVARAPRSAPEEPAAPPQNPEFDEATMAEYGTDYVGLIDFAIICAHIAADLNEGVFCLKRSSFLERIAKFEQLEGRDLAKLVDRLTMPWRNDWAAIPSGAVKADFDLARFDRRFSLSGRPIIALSHGEDPELVIAQGAIERAIFHNATGAQTGNLQNEFWSSRAMRRFASRAGSRAGLRFNHRVAERLRGLGLKAWPSAAPSWALNTKNTDELKALGDVDVLAVSADGARVWVIEAKDLKLCRTQGEAARRLSDYRGRLDEKGRPDKLLRHLQRVAFLRAHAAGLRQRLGLAVTPEIHGLVVVNAPQPMGQLQGEYVQDSTVFMLEDLDLAPWEEGWRGRGPKPPSGKAKGPKKKRSKRR